jgi:hypothetical protein
MGLHNLSHSKKELFRKQQLTLFKKVHEVVRSSVDVYLMIRRCNNHYSMFNSKDLIN